MSKLLDKIEQKRIEREIKRFKDKVKEEIFDYNIEKEVIDGKIADKEQLLKDINKDVKIGVIKDNIEDVFYTNIHDPYISKPRAIIKRKIVLDGVKLNNIKDEVYNDCENLKKYEKIGDFRTKTKKYALLKEIAK
jgi:hypothetical protein